MVDILDSKNAYILVMNQYFFNETWHIVPAHYSKPFSFFGKYRKNSFKKDTVEKSTKKYDFSLLAAILDSKNGYISVINRNIDMKFGM